MLSQPFRPVFDATVKVVADTNSERVAVSSGFPATGNYQIRLYNAGAGVVFVKPGIVTTDASADDLPVPPGAVEVITVSSTTTAPITHIAALTLSGTADLYITPGSGV